MKQKKGISYVSVIHKFLPRRGMKVTKLYTVFQLSQSPWITKYIKLNWKEE